MTINDLARAAAEECCTSLAIGLGGRPYYEPKLAEIIARHFTGVGETLEAAKAECRATIDEYGKTVATAEHDLARRLLAILEGQ